MLLATNFTIVDRVMRMLECKSLDTRHRLRKRRELKPFQSVYGTMTKRRRFGGKSSVSAIVGEFERLTLDVSAATAFASPKSSTFTLSSGVTFTFAGFKSRWMTPASCADSNASVISVAIRIASSTGIAPRLILSASVSPAPVPSLRTFARPIRPHRRSPQCWDD